MTAVPPARPAGSRPKEVQGTLGVPTFRQCGFTLTELAVVLVVVSLLIGGMLLPLSAQRDIRASQDTDRTLSDIREALVGFASANGRLPCPATAASNGLEQPTGGGACTCAPPNNCFLPAATLGITPINGVGQATDGWHFPVRYAVTAANASAFTTSDGLKPIWGALPSPDLKVGSASGCVVPLASNAVAVIWSTGKNTASGGVSADERENPNPQTGANPDPTANCFVSRVPAPDFDDQVIWLSPNILYNHMISAGKLP